MRNLFVMGLISVGLLAGCGPQMNDQYMSKERPVSKKQKASDMISCAVDAAKQVPASTQVGTTPTFTTPVTCNTYGTVSTYGGFGSFGGSTNCTGGQTFGGQTYSYDANQGLRDTVYTQCMAKKGYSRTAAPIPLCKPEQIPVGYVSDTTKVHEPIEGSCVIEGTNYSGSVVLLPKDQLIPN